MREKGKRQGNTEDRVYRGYRRDRGETMREDIGYSGDREDRGQKVDKEYREYWGDRRGS